MNATIEHETGRDSVDCLVRQFIVQEKYQCLEYSQCWFDDPDQPEEAERTLEAAMAWLAGDIAGSPGHGETYHHRIIERTEREVYLSNAFFTNPSPERTKDNEQP